LKNDGVFSKLSETDKLQLISSQPEVSFSLSRGQQEAKSWKGTREWLASKAPLSGHQLACSCKCL